MPFQILDHLDELEKYGKITIKGTWIQATCPICGGKLKITKNPTKYGAYACYTNNCHANPRNPIRQLFYKPMPFGVSNAFKPKTVTVPKLTEIVKPIYPTASAVDYLTKLPFTPPEQIREKNKVFTFFQYTGFRVVRLDARLADGTRRKYMYPEYKLPTGEYVKGLPSVMNRLPIYTEVYLQPAMIFAEGEKTATIGQKLGLATVTFPTFAFSERYIDNYAKELRSQGLTSVLYLEDNDPTGRKKASLVSNYFWLHGIATKTINLVDLFTSHREVEGFDLYDAYAQKLINRDNAANVIEELLLR